MTPQEKLYSWFLLNQRDLTFRKKKQAYSIWISEVMLQQTRVAAMLPLYESFIKKFPTVETLASSSEEEVLSAWKGLGYYSRARNIRKGAIFLSQNYNGSFPKDLGKVLEVPGIGPYTARAVLSIAYDLPFAVLDGNVKRVLSRLFLYEKNILGSNADKELQILADEFLNLKYPGDHNQAMMELGATICLPENPKCLLCPLQQDCIALSKNRTDQVPIRTKEKKKLEMTAKILWMEAGDEVLLVKEKSPRFLKGMFVLPFYFEGELPSEEYETSPFISKLSLLPDLRPYGKTFSHTITHHKFKFFVIGNSFNKQKLNDEISSWKKDIEWKWVKKEKLEEEFPSSLAKKTLNAILK
ncbi:A/G-specific adenine glycosylase [Leptospira idonii]|uniref:Adenine DNA glycosylase n=1 Tax=Leptospira idonii TaxID=1193500 RepID=A0A4R9M2H1_9LEPT|nr:A/G-specific adenine glycosylase [Leptospira idonii]TGN20171.1 A/G-specific adenine glycosylase [Leptospira idonii]